MSISWTSLEFAFRTYTCYLSWLLAVGSVPTGALLWAQLVIWFCSTVKQAKNRADYFVRIKLAQRTVCVALMDSYGFPVGHSLCLDGGWGVK
jgi:hypothetical protein